MDLKLIRNLVRIMERGEVSDLEIDDQKAGLRIHLKRGDSHVPMPGAPVVMVPPSHAPLGGPGWGSLEEPGEETAARPEGVKEITSPMVGTFYRAASPGSDNFTETGQRVDDEAVVCIIEAMKVMNEIKAEMRGEVVEILVENGDPVEFGQPLFLVKTG
jgi:acetyl-CoA carboxylase biotin carboxyl carrier protein